ncbi:extracellular solute-binding protein [Paenibacillus nasutitermitis]|uniref:ABC transporter substrate-binding protein n=1 Tax=Paenibacillus nasutitermitis TaxID=1652958 RepID=A0A917DQL0_9BACL|nr:extracellular solute-binding protein [Paenibacillus nasutitermitis]GGD57241.1 ABC transporter substrate-binding protein [Paenibacillus nasutitermitis]
MIRINRSVATLIGIIVLAAGFLAYRSLTAEQIAYPVMAAAALESVPDKEAEAGTDGAGAVPPAYRELARSYPQPGDGLGEAVVITASSYSGKSSDAAIEQTEEEGGGDTALAWNNDQGWVEWHFRIPEDGLYQLQIQYAPQSGSYDSIMRGFQIDGSYPFEEAKSLALDRYWKDSQFPYVKNKLGNEIRPVQTEIGGWKSGTISNYAVSSEPLMWQLSGGEHVLRMTAGSGQLKLASLSWTPAKIAPAYEQYLSEAEGTGTSAPGEPWFHIYEAEKFSSKSKPGIQTASVREPAVSPDPKGRIVYNAIGGERWKNAGEWVEWTMEAPRDGFYEIELKYAQTWRSKSNVYRTVAIDGKVPFRELLHYKLPETGHLELLPLQDGEGRPYRIYLKRGAHTIRLTADATQLEPAAEAMKKSIAELNSFDRKIRQISGNYGFGRGGTNIDVNRTWNLATYYPGIEEDLNAMLVRLNQTAAYLEGVHQNRTDAVTSIRVVVDTLQDYLNDIDGIPDRIADLSVAQSSLALWLNQQTDQPLMLDYIVLRTPGAQTGLKTASTASYLWYSAVDFARTFTMSYNEKSLNKEDAITIWVQRGRDYADLLNQMIEQEFTPQTGITVNVNLMPNPNALILSNAAGDQPDLVLGVSGDMPVDYAMRGAVEDLSGYEGFDEVMQRFIPGVMNGYRFNGGVYGLPEIQNFSALYYRSDILSGLGLEPPDTWEDVYRMLPTLQEQGMAFYYPPKDFATLFLENKASFYNKTGTGTLLGEKNALHAFTQWSELFGKYLFPQDVPSFLEHFRKGDVPIGIADFSTYIMLNVAAPDIAGQWKMAPLPGIKNSGGVVERWAQQPTSAAMIMKKSDKKQQAWQFMKWWTATDVQRRYGSDIESYYGLEYRWNTANVNALLSMPWPQQDLSAMKEQLRWGSNVPIVPGHYFLPRIMDFAWNDAVLRAVPAKEALEAGASDLEREMRRKQDDFGLPPDTDLQVPEALKPYDFSIAGGANP